jgi:hypothetical protein
MNGATVRVNSPMNAASWSIAKKASADFSQSACCAGTDF